MPIIGYKIKFKKIDYLEDELFTINFNLRYNDHGFLEFINEEDNYFDVGDYRILIEKMVDDFDESMMKKYDNGISILSICKYIVDNVPKLYSINYETKGMIDTYYKDEIINDYNKIKKNND